MIGSETGAARPSEQFARWAPPPSFSDPPRLAGPSHPGGGGDIGAVLVGRIGSHRIVAHFELSRNGPKHPSHRIDAGR